MTSLLITLTPDELFNKSILEYVHNLKLNTDKNILVHWYPFQEYRITLNFTSQIEPEQLNELIAMLETTMGNVGEVSANLETIGYFPNDNGKILVAYIEAGPRFKSLQLKISNFLGEVGFDKDLKVYRPHMTLARYKNLTDVPQELYQIDVPLRGNYKSIDLLEVTYKKKKRKFKVIKCIRLKVK